MSDRTAHIAHEWLAKCANVVVDARCGDARTAAGDASTSASGKPNRWFNASYANARAVDDALRAREHSGEAHGSDADAYARVFFIDVFVTCEDGGKELVERWAFHSGAEARDVGGNNHFNKDLETSVVYKRAVIMVRTLIALLRTLPAHGMRWRSMRNMNGRGMGAEAAGRFNFQIREEDDTKASVVTALADAHPGRDAGYRTYMFTDVPTSMGKLRACVYFLDALSMRALEERCVRAAHASANTSDIALVGGDMSLSPSPTKGHLGSSPKPERLIVEAAIAASALARGLRFDDVDVDDSPTTTTTTTTLKEVGGETATRPPQPPHAIVMKASQSSDSIVTQTPMPSIAMASYTSPNHQRFDNAPSSAPNRGPAPIYGFHAAPVPSPSQRAASADVATKKSIASALPPRRPESCLKIDAGTSIDRVDFTSDAASTRQHRLDSFSSPSRREGFAPTSPLASAQPESPSSPHFAGATPIACSPRVARDSPGGGSVGKSSRAPWGGFVCPESPSPSVSSPRLIRGASMNSAHPSMSSAHRASWSPSSSLGTSLRDVVGVYPHSPGAAQRRLSGAASDGGTSVGGASTSSPHADDTGEFAPFALDEDPSATYVEHTPADLLQLLEAPPALRRTDDDIRALPLDAALDDDDEDATTVPMLHSGTRQRITLDWALEEIRRMDVVKDAMRDS